MDRVLKWNIQVDPICVICKQAHEIRNHLFMECNFSMLLWKRLVHWLDAIQPIQTTWDAMLTWIVQRSKGKTPRSQLWKMVYIEFTYTIWKERNSRNFRQVEHTIEDIAKKIACVCSVRATGLAQNILERCSY